MSAAAPPKRRIWPWLLLAAALAVGGTLAGFMIYNQFSRSTPEKLKEARRLWEQAGIRDYDLVIQVTGGASGRYDVQVRDGVAVSVKRDDQELMGTSADGKPIAARQEQRDAWSIPGLFQIIQNDLDYDAKSDQPGFARVRYDARDGHVIQYVRAGRSRVVIEVQAFHHAPQ